MPLKPVRFNSPEDVTEFLDHLRKKGIISADPNIPLSAHDLNILKHQLIIGNNYETYLLCDIQGLPPEAISYSTLSFPTPDLKFFPISARHTLNSAPLLHNAPLAHELAKLIPNMNFFEVQPKCALSGKLTVFPALTLTEKTVESMTGLEAACTKDALDKQSDYKGIIPNYALLDLQLVNLKLLPHLNTLSVEEINEKINVIQMNLTNMKARINKFCAAYPETRAAKLESVLMGEDYSNLRGRILQYKENITRTQTSVDQYRIEVKRRTKHLMILAALSELIVTLPVLGYKAYTFHQTKKILDGYIAELESLEKIREEYLSKMLAKAYPLYIHPCLQLIQHLQQTLKPISPLSSSAVDFSEPGQYSHSALQFTLLPPPAPHVEVERKEEKKGLFGKFF